MRKFCKVLLITAGIIVGIGIVLCALGFAFGGGDFMRTMSRDYKSMSATFDEVEIIEVIESSNKVKIEKSSTDEVKVTYSVCEDYSYKLSNIDGKLKIEFDDYRKWYELFKFISFDSPDLVIEVPETTLKELNVKTTSGSVEAKELNCLDTTLKVTSGRIEAGGNLGDLNISSTSGSVQINSNTVAQNAEIYATSGGIEAEGFTAASLDVSSSSGSIKFRGVTAVGDMKVKCTSGSLKLEGVDAANYDLQTTSGSIRANILAPKYYDVKATSGSTNTPDFDKNAEGVLTARTTSGSIRIELAD